METDDTNPTTSEATPTEAPPTAEAAPGFEAQDAPPGLDAALAGMSDALSAMFAGPPTPPTVIMDGDYLYLVEGHRVIRTYKAVRGRSDLAS